MKNNTKLYEHYKKYAIDKNISVQYIIDNYLIKSRSMFIYEGLPDSLPQNELENLLQNNGKCFITKYNGEIVALQGNEQGERDIYGNFKSFLVNNPYVNLNKEYDLKKEGVLFLNDPKGIGLLPTIGMYAVLMTDTKISLNISDILTRMMLIISASDDITKDSAIDFVEKVQNGELSVIGENSFFDGVKTHNSGTNTNSIKQLIELNQYYKANLMNELGLNANFNMKRERLNESEIGLNIDGLLPFTHSMLHERREGVKRLNEMFDLNITVDFDSAWKIEHETADRLVNEIDTISTEEQLYDSPDPTEAIETIVPKDEENEEQDEANEEKDEANEEKDEENEEIIKNK